MITDSYDILTEAISGPEHVKKNTYVTHALLLFQQK